MKISTNDIATSKHAAFTIAELVAAMLVMTMIVAITIPITRNKMQKVDYSHYYLGYAAMKDISANAFPKFKEIIETSEGTDEDCAFEIGGTCYGTQFFPTLMTYAECAGENATSSRTETTAGAEASALGIEQCYWEEDYWAGAVKACGGTNKMPTMAQLAEIANYIYNTNQIQAKNDVSNLTMDTSKASSLGFTLNSSNAFYVWSCEEGGNHKFAYSRHFNSTSTRYTSQYRYSSKLQAVCVIGEAEEPDPVDNPKLLCETIKDMYNIKNSKCDASVADVQTSAVSLDFSTLTPHITLTNGLKIYIGSDLVTLPDLSDAVEENDQSGFIIYIDVNGKAGKSKLYEDVFPFYLLKSGKVLAAYNPALAAGGNNVDNLNCRVLYDENRTVKVLMRDATFQEAACATGMIQSELYCGENVQYEICKDMAKDCRVRENKPWQMK